MVKVKYKELSPEMEKLAAPSTGWSGRSSVGSEDIVSEYYHISLNELKPYKKQARRIFDASELQQLADTVKEHGVRQPLTIILSSDADGTYEVVSGERRLRAAKLAGLESVPCIIIKDNEQAEELALIENIQRTDLHPVELGEAYAKILENKKYGGMSDLAKKIGKPVSSISELSRLSQLPENIKTHLVEKNIRSKFILRKLLGCSTVAEMEAVLGLNNQDKQVDLKKVMVVSFDKGYCHIESKKVSYLNEVEKEDLRQSLLDFIRHLK